MGHLCHVCWVVCMMSSWSFHRYHQHRAFRTIAANSLVLMWFSVSLEQSFAHWEYNQSPQQKATPAEGHESRVAGKSQKRQRFLPVLSQVAHQVHWMEATWFLCPGSLSVETSVYIECKWDLPQGVTWEAQLSLPLVSQAVFERLSCLHGKILYHIQHLTKFLWS